MVYSRSNIISLTIKIFNIPRKGLKLKECIHIVNSCFGKDFGHRFSKLSEIKEVCDFLNLLIEAKPFIKNNNCSVPKKTKIKKIKLNFYFSDEWRRLRYKALSLHGNSCQCCGASPKTGAVIHVDHIKPRSKFPDLELELTNLQILCEACNLGKLNIDQTDWR